MRGGRGGRSGEPPSLADLQPGVEMVVPANALFRVAAATSPDVALLRNAYKLPWSPLHISSNVSAGPPPGIFEPAVEKTRQHLIDSLVATKSKKSLSERICAFEGSNRVV